MEGEGEEKFCFITERFKILILFWIGRKQRYFKTKTE